jgi:thiosulfate/3-mercaptopyruvate sulfurtransferase
MSMAMRDGYANPATLVDTAWVAARLDDPAVMLIEVDVDWSIYDTGHIPGAIGWNWQVDLQQQTIRDIPTRQDWERLLSRCGVRPDTTVVLYGDNHNWFAAFAYWLFRLYGHADVRIMNGGRRRWIAEGREMTDIQLEMTPSVYTAGGRQPEIRAMREEVLRAVEARSAGLVDVRSPAEFSGQLLAPPRLPQECAQRGGHIPGAVCIPWDLALDRDGTFQPADELRALYAGHGVDGSRPTITYCRIGERSAHTWFVLRELLGYPDVRNYDGSWTEWGSVIGAPIER